MRAEPRANRRWGWWLAVAMVAAPAGGWTARAEGPKPPALTAEQREQLKERDRLKAEALALYGKGKRAEAIRAAERVLSIEREVFGETGEDVIATLRAIAQMHEQGEDFKAARRFWKEVQSVRTKQYGEADWRAVDARLAVAHVDRLAELGGDQRRRLAEADRRNAEVNRLHQQGRYAEALAGAREVLAVRKELLGEKHPAYAQALNNLAVAYRSTGDYARALPLLVEARTVRKEAQGERHPAYASSLNNLGALYRDTGDYARALPLFKEALAVRKAVLGERHRDYATSLNNLAVLYRALGEYGKALSLYREALAVWKAVRGAESPEYVACVDNLAVLYRALGEHYKALALGEEARAITKRLRGEKHHDYAISLGNLAVLHRARGEHAKAGSLLEEALAIDQVALGERHPDYATTLHNLAAVYEDAGEYAKALPLYEQACAITKSAVGEQHPSYADSLSRYALLLYRTGDRARAEELSARCVDMERDHLDNTLGVLSERQRLTYLRHLSLSLNRYFSIALTPGADAARLSGAALAWKGTIAARHREDRLALDQPDLRPLLDQLRFARAGLAKLASNPPPPAAQKEWLKRFRDLEADKEDAERKLATASAAFRRLQGQRRATAADVAAVLPPGAALVDFVEYTHYTPPPQKKGPFQFERRLLAFVHTRDRKPACVPLGAAEPIDRAVRAWREPMRPDKTGQPPEDAASKLRRLVWQPLAKHLTDSSTVLVAPDGALCGLPFVALPGAKPGTFLIEECAIGYVTSGRHLLELAGDPGGFKGDGLLALGGLDYGKPADGPAASRQRAGFLPGTRLEAERVGQTFRARFPDARLPRLLTDDAADKPRLLRTLAIPADAPRWHYLHLATHGFFTPPDARPAASHSAGEPTFDEMREWVTYGRNPMLLSGLMLSGANRSADGILTAEEVSGLDLRGTEVVVLSACETGLGKTVSQEGMLGLQRGFQAAGARTLVSSLWSVSDPATSVLMEHFYANLWQKKLTKLEALRQAQLTVMRRPELVEARAKELRAEAAERGWGEAAALRGITTAKVRAGKPGEDRRGPPAWWAAFVLSGDPR